MNQSLDDITDNWYQRLRRLQEYNARPDLTLSQKRRSCLLIITLIQRLMRASQIYIQASMPKLKSNLTYPSGVAIVGENGHEPVLTPNETKIILNKISSSSMNNRD